MEQAPTLIDLDSELGDLYYRAMTLAGKYAYAGRDYVVVLSIEYLRAESLFEVRQSS